MQVLVLYHIIRFHEKSKRVPNWSRCTNLRLMETLHCYKTDSWDASRDAFCIFVCHISSCLRQFHISRAIRSHAIAKPGTPAQLAASSSAFSTQAESWRRARPSSCWRCCASFATNLSNSIPTSRICSDFSKAALFKASNSSHKELCLTCRWQTLKWFSMRSTHFFHISVDQVSLEFVPPGTSCCAADRSNVSVVHAAAAAAAAAAVAEEPLAPERRSGCKTMKTECMNLSWSAELAKNIWVNELIREVHIESKSEMKRNQKMNAECLKVEAGRFSMPPRNSRYLQFKTVSCPFRSTSAQAKNSSRLLRARSSLDKPTPSGLGILGMGGTFAWAGATNGTTAWDFACAGATEAGDGSDGKATRLLASAVSLFPPSFPPLFPPSFRTPTLSLSFSRFSAKVSSSRKGSKPGAWHSASCCAVGSAESCSSKRANNSLLRP